MMMTTQTLTEEQIEDLMSRYYSGERVSNLIEEFSLTVPPSRITTLFPPLVLEDLHCPYCRMPMLQDAPTRSTLKTGHGLTPPFCSSCGHRERPSCQCIGCDGERAQRQRAAEEANRCLIAQLRRSSLHPCVDINALPLRDAVHLVALCRVGRREDSDQIDPLSEHPLALRCTQRASETVVRELYELGALDISFSNAPGTICADGHGRTQLDWSATRFQLRLGSSAAESIAALHQIEGRLSNRCLWLDRWTRETLDLWYELAIDELLAYLEMRMVDHHFEPRFGAKTVQVLRMLLEQYSVYQIYNFVWSAVRDAAAYQVRHHTSRQQAANTVIGSCQRRAERALAEGWVVKPFRRDPKVPQSECTVLFANVVTRIGERFLSVPPDNTRP